MPIKGINNGTIAGVVVLDPQLKYSIAHNNVCQRSTPRKTVPSKRPSISTIFLT